MSVKTPPSCRYGHGDLLRITAGNRSSNWSLISSNTPGMAFNVQLFVCEQCGYMEMFDDNPAMTAKDEKGEAQ